MRKIIDTVYQVNVAIIIITNFQTTGLDLNFNGWMSLLSFHQLEICQWIETAGYFQYFHEELEIPADFQEL